MEASTIQLSTFVQNESCESTDDTDDIDDDTNDQSVLLEKVQEESSSPNMMSFFIVAWVTFLGEMSRGVVVPVLWPYLQLLNGTIEFLGFVSSGFSFARFLAAPFFGWWSGRRGHKEVMVICLVFLIIGNLLYALYLPRWVLLISRFIVGLGAGTLGQSRGYVSQVTTKDQRTRYMAYLTVSQFAGFAVTPGITSLLSFVDFDMFGVERLEADEYSSAGYLLAILSFVSLLLVQFVFVEPPKQHEIVKGEPKVSKGSVYSYLATTVRSIPKWFSHPEFKKILLFATLIFATRTAVAVVETASSQISSSSFAWTSQTLSYWLCFMGVLGTLILVFVPEICKKTGEKGEGVLLCVGVFSLSFGMALMIPHSKYTFIAGLFFTWAVGSSLCQTLILSFLSRVLNPNSQGAVMGWLASLGSISRIIGALWTGATLSAGASVALLTPASLMLPCLAGTSFLVYQKMRSTSKL